MRSGYTRGLRTASSPSETGGLNSAVNNTPASNLGQQCSPPGAERARSKLSSGGRSPPQALQRCGEMAAGSGSLNPRLSPTGGRRAPGASSHGRAGRCLRELAGHPALPAHVSVRNRSLVTPESAT